MNPDPSPGSGTCLDADDVMGHMPKIRVRFDDAEPGTVLTPGSPRRAPDTTGWVAQVAGVGHRGGRGGAGPARRRGAAVARARVDTAPRAQVFQTSATLPATDAA